MTASRRQRGLVLARSFNGTQLQELILYEAASRLGVHKIADVRLIRDGLLPAKQAGVGAPYFIRENDLDGRQYGVLSLITTTSCQPKCLVRFARLY